MIKVDISETELWKKFGSGDVNAFSVIYDHYADEMFRYGMKIARKFDTLKSKKS